jgi:hypothetical protein
MQKKELENNKTLRQKSLSMSDYSEEANLVVTEGG